MKTEILKLAHSLCLAGILTLSAGAAHALGFGAVSVNSEMGQSLRAEIELTLAPGEAIDDMVVMHAPVSMYERMSLPYTAAHASAMVTLGTRDSRPVVILRSSEPIREPAISVVLFAQSGQGRMYRVFNLPINTSALASTGAAGASGASGASGAVGVASAAAAPGVRGAIMPQNAPQQPAGLGAAPVYASVNSPAATPVAATAGAAPAQQAAAGAPARQASSRLSSAGMSPLNLYNSVIETDQRPAEHLIDRVPVSERGTSLLKALRLVVPKSWKAFTVDDFYAPDVAVDVQGRGRAWIAVLEDVMTRADMSATLNWERQEVTFRNATPRDAQITPAAASDAGITPAKAAAAAAGLAHEATGAALAAAAQPVVAPTPEPQKANAPVAMAGRVDPPNVQYVDGIKPLAMETKISGVDVRLVEAILRVSPSNWVVGVDDSTATESRVTWRGAGRDWVVVLSELAKPSGLTVVINTKARNVTLRK